jgi:uncharacterized damage-inducible protein DinB
MAMKDGLLAEYDREMATTRRVLARVPEPEYAWKPHEKSMSLGELAGHIAYMPVWCAATLGPPVYDVAAAGEDGKLRAPASNAAMLAKFDADVARARAAITAAEEGDLRSPWTLRNGDYEIFTLPRVAAIRSFVMNHMIHHRGQLSVYLRLRNVPVPPIYGPSADEQ